MRYKQIPHTADLAARVYGKTLEELFENAAFCMFDIMADPASALSGVKEEVHAEGPDAESLLVGWLNELLYQFSAQNIIFSEFKITRLSTSSLTAECRGNKVKDIQAVLKNEIKAATYHDVKILKREKGYEVTIVFDV